MPIYIYIYIHIYKCIYRHISKASFCNGLNLVDKLLICSKTIGTNEQIS